LANIVWKGDKTVKNNSYFKYVNHKWETFYVARSRPNNSKCANGNASIYYRLFKDNFGIEVYVDIIDNKNEVELCRSRTANYNLHT
jgi:hypothetical protein